MVGHLTLFGLDPSEMDLVAPHCAASLIARDTICDTFLQNEGCTTVEREALDAEHSQAFQAAQKALRAELSGSRSISIAMVTNLSYLAHIACKARAGSAGLMKEQFVSTVRIVFTYVPLLFLYDSSMYHHS